MIYLNIRSDGNREPWIEKFTFEDMDDFHGTCDETFTHDQEGASKWGKKLIDWFNETRKPGEPEREFCGARILEDD